MSGVTIAIVLVCAAGFAGAVSPTADAWLSTVFAWLYAVGGGTAFVVWLGVELRDWMAWMGMTDRAPRLARAEQAKALEEVDRP